MEYFDPNIDRIILLDSKKYLLNDKFFVRDFSDWDEKLRDWLASQFKLELGEEHYYVIKILRDYYSEMRIHPVVRTVIFELQKQFGQTKWNIKYFHGLFPGGIHQAYLIAGLPMQDSCC